MNKSMAVSETRSLRIWVLIVWALFVLPPLAPAQIGQSTTDEPESPVAVVVQPSVDQVAITIGDPIRYTVTVTAETNVDAQVPVFSERLGDFDIIDFGELATRRDRMRTSREPLCAAIPLR